MEWSCVNPHSHRENQDFIQIQPPKESQDTWRPTGPCCKMPPGGDSSHFDRDEEASVDTLLLRFDEVRSSSRRKWGQGSQEIRMIQPRQVLLAFLQMFSVPSVSLHLPAQQRF